MRRGLSVRAAANHAHADPNATPVIAVRAGWSTDRWSKTSRNAVRPSVQGSGRRVRTGGIDPANACGERTKMRSWPCARAAFA